MNIIIKTLTGREYTKEVNEDTNIYGVLQKMGYPGPFRLFVRNKPPYRSGVLCVSNMTSLIISNINNGVGKKTILPQIVDGSVLLMILALRSTHDYHEDLSNLFEKDKKWLIRKRKRAKGITCQKEISKELVFQ